MEAWKVNTRFSYSCRSEREDNSLVLFKIVIILSDPSSSSSHRVLLLLSLLPPPSAAFCRTVLLLVSIMLAIVSDQYPYCLLLTDCLLSLILLFCFSVKLNFYFLNFAENKIKRLLPDFSYKKNEDKIKRLFYQLFMCFIIYVWERARTVFSPQRKKKKEYAITKKNTQSQNNYIITSTTVILLC